MLTPTSELDKLYEFEQGAGHLESELTTKRPYHNCMFVTILVGQTAFLCCQKTRKSCSWVSTRRLPVMSVLDGHCNWRYEKILFIRYVRFETDTTVVD